MYNALNWTIMNKRKGKKKNNKWTIIIMCLYFS